MAAEANQRFIHSLAKVLTHFYPLAGRLCRDNATIQCTDQGAEFVTARVHCPLSRIFQNPDPEMLATLLPTIAEEENEEDTSILPLLVVQANWFECGGLALSFKPLHKLVDGHTCSTLINLWAKTTLDEGRGDHDDNQLTSSSSTMIPKFDAASYFPPLDLPPTSLNRFRKTECNEKVASKITVLRSKFASSSSDAHVPTRVQAIFALIWKCAMEASSASFKASKAIRPSTLRLSVDLRKRIAPPPVLQNLAGNFLGLVVITTSLNDDDVGDLVLKFRKGIEEANETYVMEKVPFDSNEEYRRIQDYKNLTGNVGMEHFRGTSWCRIPYYEADFGWGKPAWVSFAHLGINNLFVLMDKKDCRGIEAWVTLSPEIMDRFESDAELLTYASVNPSVL